MESFAPVEIERNAPLTFFEKVGGVLASIAPVLGIVTVALFCATGCVADSGVDGSTSAGFPEVEHWWK